MNYNARMDMVTARKLNSINRRFYEDNALSFSDTRQQGWPGWERVIELCGIPSSVLDIACGNLRFARFLRSAAPDADIAYYGIDISDELVSLGDCSAAYQKLDVVDAALTGLELDTLVEAPSCQLVVAFGFMHHVPGTDARMRIMKLIADKMAPGGLACLSFWQFMQDPRLAKKAVSATKRALANEELDLDEGDYILDWQGDTAAQRYCHSFTEAEVGEIAASVSKHCSLVATFNADGRSDALNTYIVLRRR